MKSWDIKLTDGRYFSNVIICDEDGKNELAKCYSKDIEYVCKSYEYNCLQ